MLFNKYLNSKSVNRFREVNRMSEDDLVEFFFDCYCEYVDTFCNRIHMAKELGKVLGKYRSVKGFGSVAVRKFKGILFKSPIMQEWFAGMFWFNTVGQVSVRNFNKKELYSRVVFMPEIPLPEKMDEIINGKKDERRKSHPGSEVTIVVGAKRETGRANKQTV